MQTRKVNKGLVGKVQEEPKKEGLSMFTSWVNMWTYGINLVSLSIIDHIRERFKFRRTEHIKKIKSRSISCSELMVNNSDWSGSKNFDPGWVSHLWIWKIPPKIQIFQFFPLRSKKYLWVGSKKYPGSKAGQTLFYCGLKASSSWVGSGPISTYQSVAWSSWTWQPQNCIVNMI